MKYAAFYKGKKVVFEAGSKYEASVIEARLRHFQGNRMLVAESLNIPKRTLDHKCQKLEVN